MISKDVRQARRDARDWRDAAEEALSYAEAKLANPAHRRDQLPPAIRGDIFRATWSINAYEKRGQESAYGRRNHQRFLDGLQRYRERIIKIKDRCTIRTGNCIDCNQGSHPANECPKPAELTDSDVSPWETTDEDTDSDMPDLDESDDGPDEETMEDWFWQNKRIKF